MKKTALVLAATLLASSSAYAYENLNGGYIVNDSKATATINSQKTFGYVNTQNKIPDFHMVNYFTPAEVKEITGAEFTQEKFQALYEQLAPLDRSQIALAKLPLDMLDLRKYAESHAKGSFLLLNTDEKFQGIKANIRFDKLGKNKTMTFSYLFKQENNYLSCDTSFLTANDRLYLLTSVNSTDPVLPTTDKEDVLDATVRKEPLKEKIKEKGKLKPVDADQVDNAILNNLWKKHLLFVKGFKTQAPVETKASFGYVDANYGKKVNLPDDWAYTQLRLEKEEGNGIITISAPLDSIRYAANDSLSESLGLYNNKKDVDMDQVTNGNLDEDTLNRLWAHDFLQKMDSVLITGSFQVKDKDLTEMLNNPLSLRLEAYTFLKGGLEHLKKHPTVDFQLNDYDLDVKTSRTSGLVNINADMTLLQDVNLDGQARMAISDDALLMLVFAKQKDQASEELLQQAIDAWQF